MLAGWPGTSEVAEPAIPREVRFLSDVKTLERNRTSRGIAGSATSRVAHEMLAGWPGTSVAATVVLLPSEVRLVIKPGLIVTLVRSPGTTSVSSLLPAEGTGR